MGATYENSTLISKDAVVIRWREKLSLLMVTMVMSGTWLIAIPFIGHFNQTINLTQALDLTFSIIIIMIGIFLLYLGLSTSYTTLSIHKDTITLISSIGFLQRSKTFKKAPTQAFEIQAYEDEDGVTYYKLVLTPDKILLDSLDEKKACFIQEQLQFYGL